jgi:hypothetical protein
MATITVKSARKDGRVAFFERDKAHPKGEVFIRGDQQTVEVGDTRALRKAIRDGNLVEVTQAAPVSRQQTPPTKTQGNGAQKTGDNEPPKTPTESPWEGYDEATVDDVVARLGDLDDAGRANVLAYEKANKKRAGVIEPLVNWNS